MSALCKFPRWFRWAAVALPIIWLGNLIIGTRLESGKLTGGTFGDMFGAANSIFSGFALLGVALGVWMQNNQLKQSAEALEITIEERNTTNKILADQQANLERQVFADKKRMFETTFFQLLTAFTDISKSVTFKDHKSLHEQSDEEISQQNAPAIYTAADAFQKFYYKVFERHSDRTIRSHKQPIHHLLMFQPEHMYHGFRQEYTFVVRTYAPSLAQYFRTLYNILNFIHLADLGDEQWFYAKLVRAQLSNDEATALLFNYLSKDTTPQFNVLICKYGMLKNFNKQAGSDIYMKAIPEEAFGNRHKRKQERIRIAKINAATTSDDPK